MKNNKSIIIIPLIVIGLWACGDGDSAEPMNTAPAMSAQSFSASEAVGDADIIGTVTATDPDGDALTFSITTNDNDLFEITNSGALSLATGKGLDFDMAANHTITVQVSDGALSTSATITISVQDINENTIPSIASQSFSAAEDIDDVIEIGVIVATDVDDDNLTFTIATNDDGLFEISEVGVLSLSEGRSLDFETKQSHQITVQVSDGVSIATAIMTINVTDIADTSFITTWETTNANESITIPINPDVAFTYNYNVDWGDGTNSNDQLGDATHTYSDAGTYVVAITGVFPAIYFNDSGSKDKIKTIEQWGNIAWESMQHAFFGCINLTYSATDVPDLSKVTTMRSMFASATLFDGAIGNWDLSNVNILEEMFFAAETFNQDINGWNVSNVSQMGRMFQNATAFNQNLGNWDVSSVTNMRFMFFGASSFNKDISSWDLSSLVVMDYMFFGASSFNQDISSWDVSSVPRMESVFKNATSFDQNLGNWDISSLNSTGGFDPTLRDFFENAGLSTANYDATLKGWSELSTVPSDIILGANSLKYCDDGEVARAALIAKGWIFEGDSKGLATDCE